MKSRATQHTIKVCTLKKNHKTHCSEPTLSILLLIDEYCQQTRAFVMHIYSLFVDNWNFMQLALRIQVNCGDLGRSVLSLTMVGLHASHTRHFPGIEESKME